MKKLLYIAFIVLAIACTKEINQGEVAARVAKHYYDTLVAGHYDAFLEGTYQQDSIPKRYRDLLLDNAKMFIAQQQTEHQGIKEVRVIRHRADTAKHTADVFLVLTFGDSTSEQIVVPMIQHKGTWLMR